MLEFYSKIVLVLAIFPIILQQILLKYANKRISVQIFDINQFFLEPYLFPKEKLLFYEYLDKSHIYFEYGSGGSTHQAAKRGLTIITAEVGLNWISYLQSEIENINTVLIEKVNITYLYSDLQTELDPSRENFTKYVTLYNHSKYKADLIYIDGQYHSSCIFNIYKQIDENTIVIVHELDKPSFRKTIKNFYDQISKVGRLLVLRKKKTKPEVSKKMMDEIQESDFTHSSKKIRIIRELRKNYSEIINRYLDSNIEKKMKKPTQKQVWFFWWQGIDTAPPIVKTCLGAIQQNNVDGIVTVVSQYNIRQIVEIPEFIYEKLYNKNITFTNFADIVRFVLVSTFGGLWIDATILAVKKVPSEVFEYPFYSVHFDDDFKYVTGKWVGFCHFSYINGVVSSFVADIMIEYMRNNQNFLDYFMIDYVTLLGYDFIPSIKRLVQKVPFNNPNVLQFMNHFNDKYTTDGFEYWTKDTFFFKTSWKIRLIPYIEGHQTIFGKMAETYLDNKTYKQLLNNSI